MDLEKIKEIIRLMNEENLAEIEVEEEGKRIKLRKREEGIIRELPANFSPPAASSEPGENRIEEGISYINAPMVGTFYRAPSPDTDPFVAVGDIVEPGKTVCIIEAMKLMNEIKSEIKGRVVEVLVENGDPVDYGQPVFKITSKI